MAAPIRSNGTGRQTVRAGSIWPSNSRENFWFRVSGFNFWSLLALCMRRSLDILWEMGPSALEAEEKNVERHLMRIRDLRQKAASMGRQDIDPKEANQKVGFAASFMLTFTGKADRDGSIGYAYFDHNCSEVIHKEMGENVPQPSSPLPFTQSAPVPPTHQPVQQPQPVKAVEYGNPVGLGTLPVIQTEDQSPSNSQEAEVAKQLARAAQLNDQMQAMMGALNQALEGLKK